jgi:hypothetical protein
MAARRDKAQAACQHAIVELIADAVVGRFSAEDQHDELAARVQDRVVCPFRARVIGELVEVMGFAYPGPTQGLDALCKYRGQTYSIAAASVEWVDPLPAGFEWLEAYLAWRGSLE